MLAGKAFWASLRGGKEGYCTVSVLPVRHDSSNENRFFTLDKEPYDHQMLAGKAFWASLRGSKEGGITVPVMVPLEWGSFFSVS